jgi:hypothetical protein
MLRHCVNLSACHAGYGVLGHAATVQATCRAAR